ncbi:MAG: PTS sugar transporter subunit IIA [Planctomycetota bacterium]|nr:MAG: PTS sugar transporter subunit IIA [Planctomycetota bacterium]
MRLSDLIGKEGIVHRLKATDRDEALMMLVQHLVDTGRIAAEHQDDILTALCKREALGATNIGNGVAIPHVKTELVNEFMGVLARSREGIDFGGDEDPVHVIILFLSPARAVSGHLRLLAHIGGILKHDGYVQLLRSAETRAELYELIQDAERMLGFATDDDDDRDTGQNPVLIGN